MSPLSVVSRTRSHVSTFSDARSAVQFSSRMFMGIDGMSLDCLKFSYLGDARWWGMRLDVDEKEERRDTWRKKQSTRFG